MAGPVMQFQVVGPQGDTTTVDDGYIMQNLNALGYQPQGISPDGTTLTLLDAEGPYEVKVEDALKDVLGWQPQGVQPLNADYSQVSPELRALVHQMPDDLAKRSFLEGKMREYGHQDTQIIGQGRDWYAYNPHENKWMGLTNSPEWDLSDLSEAGLVGGRALASAGGAIAGALTGGGVGAIPGAAAGGAAFDIGSRGISAAIDPAFRDVAEENLGGMAKDVGMGAAIDAGTMGLGRMIPTSAMRAPLSAIGQKLGSFAEETGKGLSKVGGFMGGKTASEVASTIAAPDAGMVTMGLQLPREVMTAIPRAAGWLAESPVGQKMLSEEARQGMLNWSQNLLKPRVPQTTWAEEMAQSVAGQGSRAAYRPGARDVATNIADTFRPQGPDYQSLLGKPLKSPAWADAIENAGRYADMFASAGEQLQKPLTAATQGLFKTAQGVGAGMRYGGGAMRNAGQLGRALEAPAYGQMSYQAMGRPMMGAEEEAMFPRRPKKRRANEPVSHD